MNLDTYAWEMKRAKTLDEAAALKTREERIAFICKYPATTDEERRGWIDYPVMEDHGDYVIHMDTGTGDTWITSGNNGSCLFYTQERLRRHITWIDSGKW